MPLPTISVEGRLIGEVQLRYTDEGVAVARFRMLAADRRRQPDGQWVETEKFWITITAFRKLAENAADSLRDRDAVVVVGKLSTAEWSDAEGRTQSAPKLIASSIGPSLFFLPRPHSSARPAPTRTPAAPAQVSEPDGWGPSPSADDDPWGPS